MPPIDAPPLSLAFLAGFLSFISPCVLPLVPAYVSYLGVRVSSQTGGLVLAGGTGASSGSIPANRFAIFAHGMLFVSGFTLVFVIFGLAVNTSLQILGVSSYDLQQGIARIGGILVIFFGLHVMGLTGWILLRLLER